MGTFAFEIPDQSIQFLGRSTPACFGIVIFNKMDVCPESIFVTDPVEQLKGFVPLKGIPRNTNGTRPPLLAASGFSGLLKVHLKTPVQLKECIGKNGYQSFSGFMVIVDIKIEQNHNGDGR